MTSTATINCQTHGRLQSRPLGHSQDWEFGLIFILSLAGTAKVCGKYRLYRHTCFFSLRIRTVADTMNPTTHNDYLRRLMLGSHLSSISSVQLWKKPFIGCCYVWTEITAVSCHTFPKKCTNMNTKCNTDDADVGWPHMNPEMNQPLSDNKLVTKEKKPRVKASGREKPNDEDMERW